MMCNSTKFVKWSSCVRHWNWVLAMQRWMRYSVSLQGNHRLAAGSTHANKQVKQNIPTYLQKTLETQDTECSRLPYESQERLLGGIAWAEYLKVSLFWVFTLEKWAYIQTKTCTHIHKVKYWKQTKCPSVGEWIHKLGYSQNVI